ncbi:hypothetical protein [Archaeoglobus sp.]
MPDSPSNVGFQKENGKMAKMRMNELEIKKRWLEQEIAIMKMLETVSELEKKISELETELKAKNERNDKRRRKN